MGAEKVECEAGLAILPPSSTEGWLAAARPGLWSRPLYADAEQGRFFGWIRFEAMAATGLHRHLGPASSYFVEGGLHDFQGEVVAGQMGINLDGATHDAIAYRPTLFVARLESPVVYLGDDVRGALHTGARAGEIIHEDSARLPDINITVDDLPLTLTDAPGVARRMVFDYGGAGVHRRCVQLQMLPGASLPRFRTRDRLDLFVLGGGVEIGATSVGSGALAAIAGGCEIELASLHGALLFAWSEAPVEIDGADPFGF
jgi:hypothetical protein